MLSRSSFTFVSVSSSVELDVRREGFDLKEQKSRVIVLVYNHYVYWWNPSTAQRW